jgi:hypothetical protein
MRELLDHPKVKGGRARSKAQLHWARADGEPTRAGGRRDSDPGERHGRAGGIGEYAQSNRQTLAPRITVGEEKGYDVQDHVAALRQIHVTPHVAQNDAVTKTGKRRRSRRLSEGHGVSLCKNWGNTKLALSRQLPAIPCL